MMSFGVRGSGLGESLVAAPFRFSCACEGEVCFLGISALDFAGP